VAAAERAGDAPEGRRAVAESRLHVGLMEVNLARLGAGRLELERALERFRQVGDGGGEGRALDALAMATALAGELDTAVAHAQAALPRLAAAGDRQTEASCTASLAFVLFYRGRRAEGDAAREEALALARAIGARAQEAAVRSITGELVEPFRRLGPRPLGGERGARRRPRARPPGVDGRRAGNPRTASPLLRRRRRRLHDEMLAIARDLRTTLWIAEAVGEVGQNAAAAGSADAAGLLVEAVQLAGEATKFATRSALGLAELGLRQGGAGAALEAARQFQQRYAEYAVFVADARRIEGEALAALGQPADGEALLRQPKAETAALGALPAGWRAGLALARLLDRTGRADEARLARADARRLLERVAAGLSGVPDLLRGFQASPMYREAAGR
jgi:tetratricopeptide (TPR) repeat protein